MKKFIVGLIASAVTIFLMAAAVYAQTALDPTQGGALPEYPNYLDHSCGGVKWAETAEQGNVAMFRFSTTCSSGGRGSKPRTYVACWWTEFAEDRFTVIYREQKPLVGTQCPGL